MPVEVILPKVDMDMSHGKLATWHVAEGETVAKGAPLFDIETDKAAMEVEAPASGRLGAVAARPGDTVAVGTVVALIFAEDEAEAPAPFPAKVAKETASGAASDGGDDRGSEDAVEVILPKVDMDMSHGRLATWHVAEGDPVVKGAPLFDIETDKAAMEVEAPASGTLHHVTARPGDLVPVGTVVAFIHPAGYRGGPRPAAMAESATAPSAEKTLSASRRPVLPVPSAVAASGLRATPAARALARVGGLDLAEVRGSGPRGRIQRDDVAAFAALRAEAGRRLSAEGFGSVGDPPAIWQPQGGPLHVSAREGQGVPVLLLHGFTADSQSWAPLEKALGPGRPLIRIDLPGHGRSPRRRVGGFAELARMLVEAFDDALRDHGKVDLVGHSLGGALALALADIRPRRIRSVGLIAPAGLGPEVDARTLEGITHARRVESLAPWLRRLTATPAGITDDYARAAMRLRADPALRACQADLAQALFPDGVQAFDLRPALSRLECPTALIWGRQDHILPWQQAISVTGDFALHLLADAGHVPQIECPDRVARILDRHLATRAAEG